jgi:hypothetical protein
MNFNFGRFFYLLLNFVVGVFFLACGILGIMLPWSPALQQAATQLIVENTVMLSLFGLGFTLIGLSLIIYALLSTRRRYTTIRTGAFAVTLDKNIVHDYLEAYWEEHFPEAHVPFDLTLKKRSIQIRADLPAMPYDEQKIFLEKVKRDFSDLFGRLLGYPYDVHLTASFQPEKSLSN